MPKTKTIWKILPVVTAALVLGGCGGGDGGDDGGSITACFTVNKEVSYALKSINLANNTYFPERFTVKPTTYNGQQVVGEIGYFSKASNKNIETAYWQVNKNGVIEIGMVSDNAPLVYDGTSWPADTKPGQTATSSTAEVATFVGFETLTLAGKTFTNVCRFKATTTTSAGQKLTADVWVAPEYGHIQQISPQGTFQYNGNL